MILNQPRTIYVDTDNTLDLYGELNETLVNYLIEKKQEGYTIILWSMAGRNHAFKVAEEYNLIHLFDTFLTKPGIIIDDKGIRWMARTVVLDEELNTVEY